MCTLYTKKNKREDNVNRTIIASGRQDIGVY